MGQQQRNQNTPFESVQFFPGGRQVPSAKLMTWQLSSGGPVPECQGGDGCVHACAGTARYTGVVPVSHDDLPQPTRGLKELDDLVGKFLRGFGASIQGQFGLLRCFIGIIDAGKALDFPSASLLV